MNDCLSELALDDRAIHGAASPEADRHLHGCASCQTRLRARAERVGEFDQQFAGPVWQAVLARRRAVPAAARRRSPRVIWLALVLAGGGGLAALQLRVARDRRPAPAPAAVYLAAKGRALAEIVCRRGGRVFVLAPGQAVAPGDELRFRPLPVWPEAAYIQIGSVDGTGAYVTFYPARGEASVPLPAPGAPLDGSVRLDGAPGPERLFLVLSRRPLAVTAVSAAARAHAARRDQRVEQIDGAPVLADWVVLDKPDHAAGP